MKRWFRKAFHTLGFDIVRHRPRLDQDFPDVTDRDRRIVERIAGFTMTSLERQLAVIQAVRYLTQYRIAGSIVECGVWRGGSSMAAALTLIDEGDTGRSMYLYDTYEGMTPPKDVDRNPSGKLAQTQLDKDPSRTSTVWAVADLDDVQRNMGSTGYPADKLHYIKGPIENTIPGAMPEAPIALLRLDTDWYESTKHELEHLYPLLCKGGILIIDDYGHWQGARKAVDEYFASLGQPCFLHRIDYTGRMFVKA